MLHRYNGFSTFIERVSLVHDSLTRLTHLCFSRTLIQSLLLGLTQITVSSSVNFAIVLMAGTIAAFLATRPTWLKVQRYLMATVLGGLAVRLAFDNKR